MSPIAICLDLVLITLLFLALWIGFRLEKRLKLLRDSQAGFVNAVAELNAGVDKAQSGLAELRAATLEARTELADRIQDAKGMTSRLERQAVVATEAAVKLEALIERANAIRPMPMRPPAPSAHPGEGRDPGLLGRLVPRREPVEREEPLTLRRAALSQPVEKSLDPGLRRDERLGGVPADTRSRARIDDDLFEGPLSIRGGR